MDQQDLQYSGYPGDSFPKQCGAGYGYGGFGQYGTYAGSEGNADQIDYNVASACGGEATVPKMPCCPPVIPQPPANRCGPENFASLSALAPQNDVGCGMGDFWADKTCRLPPNHCGSQPCCNPRQPRGCNFGGNPTGTVENYVGDLGDAGRFAGYAADGSCGASVYDGCDSKLQVHRDPGYAGLRCSMPYSAPYHAGPNACASKCDDGVEGMSGSLIEGVPSPSPSPSAPSPSAPAPTPSPTGPPRPNWPRPRPPPVIVVPGPSASDSGINMTHVIIALIIAYLVLSYAKKR